MTKIRGVLLIVLLGLLPFAADFNVRATDQNLGSSSQDSAAVKRICQEDQADRDIDYESMTEQQRKEWRERAHAHDVLASRCETKKAHMDDTNAHRPTTSGHFAEMHEVFRKSSRYPGSIAFFTPPA